jgi:hypothetical protein
MIKILYKNVAAFWHCLGAAYCLGTSLPVRPDFVGAMILVFVRVGQRSPPSYVHKQTVTFEQI